MISKELFKYTVLTLFMGFAAACLMAPRFIPLLHRLKFGQEVRDDGPKAHLKKQGTPTMGGIFIVISVLIAVLLGTLGYGLDKEALMVLFISIAFGAIGFTDDYLKIRKHQSEGLKPLQKLSMQLIVTLVFAWLVYEHGSMGGKLWIPFMGIGDEARLWLDLPAVIYFPLVIFTVLGTDNGVNFTDGLDGLCSSVTAVTAAFFAVCGLLYGSGVSLTAAAVCGALMAFLLYNVYPAKVFMGDTGSLALGGFVSGAAVVMGMELYIPIVGFIYLIEVASVIIQVSYFKATGGKRIFRMAPIHHHFELLGNSETRIVAAFTIITALLCIISLFGICIYI